jgi:hypothetical protein
MTSAPPRPRRLLVLGATGGTGRAVVDRRSSGVSA